MQIYNISLMVPIQKPLGGGRTTWHTLFDEYRVGSEEAVVCAICVVKDAIDSGLYDAEAHAYLALGRWKLAASHGHTGAHFEMTLQPEEALLSIEPVADWR